ncbi:MAG: pseudouridine synthase [Cellvibrionaceae bacterium]
MADKQPPQEDESQGYDASEKLQKVLANAGFGSRREMERVISEGRVKVNGQVAKLGDRVTPEDRIQLDGKSLKSQGKPKRRRVIIYNKPEGQICSSSDPKGRPTVYQNLPRLHGERWISIGRLDFNTSGLLLFTNDGELANRLMHPSSNIDREYLVRIQGAVDDAMCQRLADGVLLDDGMANFTDIVEAPRQGEGSNQWFYVCLMEGRNREVRRLWESQDVRVSRLKRVRFGEVFLPSHVRSGQWEEMDKKSVDTLCKRVDLKPDRVRPTREESKVANRQEKRLRASAGRRKKH